MRNILLYFILIKSIEGKSPLRIIGGRDAASDEHPYVVRIELQLPIIKHDNSTVIHSVHICSGSVISPNWTLSAAHCFHFFYELISSEKTEQSLIVRSDENFTLVIRHGSVNATPSETDAFSRVDYYIKHPAFKIISIKYLKDIRVHNDVALVHHQPISSKQYGKVAGLDFTSLTGHEVTIAGYGKTHDSQGKLLDTLVLQKPLQVFSGVVVQCQPNKMTYPTLCVARKCGQVMSNACGGDSGGPVIHPAGIVAVLTKALPCSYVRYETRTFPAVIATPLSPYIQWISDHIRKNHKTH